MINDYVIDINLPVQFIPHEFLDTGHYEERLITPELVNHDFHLWLKSLDLKIDPMFSRFFSRTPSHLGNIHVDNFIQHSTKINIIYDSFNSLITWYDLLPNKSYTKIANSQGEIIAAYDPNDCERLYSRTVNKTCLFNGKIPHRVQVGTNNNKSRKCYSLLLLDKNDNRISWDDAMKIFAPYFIIKNEVISIN